MNKQRVTAVIPTTSAKIASALRAGLHMAVVVALILYMLHVDRTIALLVGVLCAPFAAIRARRVSIRFAGNALAVDNYFRSYRILDLDSTTLHQYRGRVELEHGNGARTFLQGANFQNIAAREELLSELALRGAKVPTQQQVVG